MKLKVAFTRRSNFDISDLDFLTEARFADPKRRSGRGSAVGRGGRRTVDGLGRPIVRPQKTQSSKDNPKGDTTDGQVDKVLGAPSTTFTVVDGSKVDQLGQNAKAAVDRFKTMMGRIGNSLSGFFNMLTGWLKGLPLAKSILGKLKPLWEKIKAWGTKFRIIGRAKNLSMATVYCVGFIAAMVGSWIYNIIFGKISKRSMDARWKARNFKSKAHNYMDRFNNPGKYITNAETPQDEDQDLDTETAVFIETFGEILREDTNGGMLMAPAKKFITNTCNSGKIDAICKVADNSNNVAFKNLSKNLSICTKGPNAIIQSNGRLLPTNGNKPTTETRFDNSLPALYESIIREAQAHKIKSIKKKAIKKVAMKKAKAKKSLRGRM